MAIGHLPRKARLATLINFKVKVTTTNGSQFIGTLLSFDKYMNVVLSECEEFRITKKSELDLRKQAKDKKKIIDESNIKEQKRLLGLIILRGEGIISVVVESAPNLASSRPSLRLNKGRGVVKPLIKTLPRSQQPTISGRIEKPSLRR